MPQLTIRGVSEEIVARSSGPLVEALAKICQAETLDFTVDLIRTQSFFAGKEVATFPFVEVGWFDRGQQVQDAAAKCIDTILKHQGIEQVEVVFKVFEKKNYYCDGDHY